MKPTGSLFQAVLLTTTILAGSAALAQQVSPKTPADLAQPSSDVIMQPEYAAAIARTAYVWGWPMVNMFNRRAAITRAPEPGKLNGILPAAPRGQVGMLNNYIDPGETFIACPNQDVVYGLGFFDLDKEPVIAQIPDFGDRFWVYSLYDAHRSVCRTRQTLRHQAWLLPAGRAELER